MLAYKAPVCQKTSAAKGKGNGITLTQRQKRQLQLQRRCTSHTERAN